MDLAYIWIGFRPTKYGFSIWAGDDNEILRDKIRFRVNSIKTPYNWRSAALSLIGLNQAFADEESLEDIKVTGEIGWRAELLALCWVQQDLIRDETKKFLINLDEKTLDQLAKDLGSLISKRSIFLLSRYFELASLDPLECWSKAFPENSGFSFKKLVLHLGKQARENTKAAEKVRYAALAPFRVAINQIIQENRNVWERFGNGGGMGTSINYEKFVSCLEDFVLDHQRLPNNQEMTDIRNSYRHYSKD
jgi:hypothetical protein